MSAKARTAFETHTHDHDERDGRDEYLNRTRLINALRHFVQHVKPAATSERWPCVYCGRSDEDAFLVVVMVTRSDGVKQVDSCWYCRLEGVVEEAERALERNGVKV